MNGLEQEKMEAELRRVTPARLPANLMNRLVAAKPPVKAQPPARRFTDSGPHSWLRNLRWLMPATAVTAVAVVAVWRADLLPPGALRAPAPNVIAASSKGGDVKIDRELLSSFDAIGRLPDGEPVRFRCQNWMDQVVLRDQKSGLVVQQRTPRMEITPVRFETY